MFTVSQHNDSSVIAVQHDLDLATTASLGRAIAHAALATGSRIVVSLVDCHYCDASGLRVLLAAKSQLGRRLSIVVPRVGSVRRIFELTELTERLELCDDLDLAVISAAASG